MQGSTWKRVAVAAALTAGGVGTFVVATGGPVGADRAIARATLYNGASQPVAVGEVVFRGHGIHADRVDVTIALPPDAPGLGAFHGFHIHSVGTCAAPFTSAGGHWNLVSGAEHGNHTGDMPSILVGPDGTATARFETQRFDVNELFDANGSAVILHAGVDNFGNVPLGGGKYEDPNAWRHATAGTANTGDAGSRYACGIVEP